MNTPNPPPSTPRPPPPRSQMPAPRWRYYSASTRGFYSSDVHTKEKMPTDAVLVSEQQYEALFRSQTKGHTIVPDEKGNPTTMPPKPDPAALATIQAAQLAKMHAATDAVLVAHMAGENVLTHAQLAELLAYRKALRIPGASVPKAPTWMR